MPKQRTAHAAAVPMCASKIPTASRVWAASLEAAAPIRTGIVQLVHISAEMVIFPLLHGRGGGI